MNIFPLLFAIDCRCLLQLFKKYLKLFSVAVLVRTTKPGILRIYFNVIKSQPSILKPYSMNGSQCYDRQATHQKYTVMSFKFINIILIGLGTSFRNQKILLEFNPHGEINSVGKAMRSHSMIFLCRLFNSFT